MPAPDEVPGLQARVERGTTDAHTLTRLAAAYHADDRTRQALPLIERAVDADPGSPTAALVQGLVYEDLGRLEDAAAAYRRLLTLAPESPRSDYVEGRLRLIRREQLRTAVRNALAREADLPASPEATALAVFPFQFDADDEELRPLRFAMADMLVTDLSQTDRLTVLERINIQALLDEVALGAGGLVDPSTAARSGRLLGAGRVVQGRITGDVSRLTLDAVVVAVGEDEAPAPVSQADAVDRLFEMEKALVFGIYEELGIPLTAAERERINERYTDNLQALLAYGLGLEAEFAGRFTEARTQFQRAAEMDPGFTRARRQAAAAGELAVASTTGDAQVVDEVAMEAVSDAVDLQVNAVAEAAAAAAARDATQEVLGTEGVGRATGTRVILTLPRPGGGR